MYTYDYYYSPYDVVQPRGEYSSAVAGGIAGLFAGAFAMIWIILLALSIVYLIGLWKMFKKANVDGWESLIPIHNTVVELQLGGIKSYWVFLTFIPFVNLIIYCWKSIRLAKAYGKDVGFGIGLILLPWIFVPILGFGTAQYVGIQDNSNMNQNNNTSNVNQDGSFNTNSSEQ